MRVGDELTLFFMFSRLLRLLRNWLFVLCGRLRLLLIQRLRRGKRPFGRGEDESAANQGEALLRELGLQKLIVGSGEEFALPTGNGGLKVVNLNGLGVERAPLVGQSCELNGGYGASLLGDDGPEVAAILRGGEREKGLKRAGIKIREKDGGGVGFQARRGRAAVGGGVQEKSGYVGFAG